MLDRCLMGVAALFLCLVPYAAPSRSDFHSAIDPKATLECHRREYTYKATKTDFEGRMCWDYLRVMACWGRCDSFEIPDWRFPYKKSYHPVCWHENTKVRRVALRNCDEGVNPALRIYEYVEATTCTCHMCNTSTASCEAPLHLRAGDYTGLPYSSGSSSSMNFLA